MSSSDRENREDFSSDAKASEPPTTKGERVAFTKGDALDDLAIDGDLISMVRLERMAGNHFWGAIYMRDGRDLRLSFWVEKRSLSVTAEWEGRRCVALEATSVDPSTATSDPLHNQPKEGEAG